MWEVTVVLSSTKTAPVLLKPAGVEPSRLKVAFGEPLVAGESNVP